MHLCRQGGQLPRPRRDRKGPFAGPLIARCHPGDQSSQKGHRSTLLPGSRRLLPTLREELRSYRLTRKDAVFHWSADCQEAFDRLKTLLTTSPITAFPNFSLPFRLYTDTSTAGLGAILAQVREGKERIICCASSLPQSGGESLPCH